MTKHKVRVYVTIACCNFGHTVQLELSKLTQGCALFLVVQEAILLQKRSAIETDDKDIMSKENKWMIHWKGSKQ